MQSGTVISLKADKGFGFIAGVNGAEYFFHRTSLVNPAQFAEMFVGASVTFENEESEKGPRAARVELVG